MRALANMKGKPIAFVLAPGRIADISVAGAIRDNIAPPQRPMADKVSDANHLRQQLQTLRH